MSGSLSPANPYENPELFRFVGSMEGVPEWIDPAETIDERRSWAPWQRRANQLFAMLGSLLPGLVIALALAVVGREGARWLGADLLGFEKSPVSPILIAILLGLLLRNAIGLPAVYELGLQLALKRILRIGVALLGIRLSLAAVGEIGLLAVPIVVACIATALAGVGWVCGRLGLPRRLGALIAVGTAICGNTAIVATGPAIGANDDETSYAVGCITVFGLIALIAYPFLAHAGFGGDARMAGFFLGTAIHDTAQVAGAGLMYLQQYDSPVALETATVTKLVRNVFMVAVIPLMAVLYRQDGGREGSRPSLATVVPLFVLGFVALALLRTVGDLGDEPFYGLLSAEGWQALVAGVSSLSTWCLTVAMASVGLGTNLRRLRQLGLRPLGVGLAAAAAVGLVSAALILAMAPLTGCGAG